MFGPGCSCSVVTVQLSFIQITRPTFHRTTSGRTAFAPVKRAICLVRIRRRHRCRRRPFGSDMHAPSNGSVDIRLSNKTLCDTRSSVALYWFDTRCIVEVVEKPVAYGSLQSRMPSAECVRGCSPRWTFGWSSLIEKSKVVRLFEKNDIPSSLKKAISKLPSPLSNADH